MAKDIDYSAPEITVSVGGRRLEHVDDCFAYAQELVRDAATDDGSGGLDGYDLEPRWDDERERNAVLLTIPGWAWNRPMASIADRVDAE